VSICVELDTVREAAVSEYSCVLHCIEEECGAITRRIGAAKRISKDAVA
jgi:hypothetical protein